MKIVGITTLDVVRANKSLGCGESSFGTYRNISLGKANAIQLPRILFDFGIVYYWIYHVIMHIICIHIANWIDLIQLKKHH